MKRTSSRGPRALAAALACFVGASVAWLVAYQSGGTAVAIDPDDIGGVVTSSKGPEAGVWVIAETTELPTRFIKIAVTDDRGRYVVPDLPRASYQVFVRGYGLVDSPRQPGQPGQQLNLKVDIAADAKTAGQAYPAAWWLAMLEMPKDYETQKDMALSIKQCLDCHQLGNKATREIDPKMVPAATHLEAWDMRTQFGPSGPTMAADFQRLKDNRQRFADWTERIAKGEGPSVAPPRPTGAERNLVVTLWDWGTPLDGRSDSQPTDTRNVSVNANGPVWGVSQSTDTINRLDPVAHKVEIIKVPSPAKPLVSTFSAAPSRSPYWGEDIWRRVSDPRSVAVDAQGRVWLAVRTRDAKEQPSFCTSASNKFARNYPIKQAGKQVGVYDQRTGEWAFVDTCFTTDHNEMDHNNLLYFGSSGMVGWVDMSAWDKTKNAEASQGWCPGVVDTNGDGKITPGWTEPGQPIDPTKDTRIQFGCYSVAVNEKDGTLWCSGIGRGDRTLVRLERGPNPPETCRAEVFVPPPAPPPMTEVFGSGGVQVDSQGVVWQGWRVSGHFTAFDRSKCKSTKDPQANGQSCPEGWSIYRNNMPTYANSAFHTTEGYLTYIDRADVLGLGKDSPMVSSMNTDSLEVVSSRTQQFVHLRVPYPFGFFGRSAGGRIDDPKAGWKGRGLWSSYSNYAPWHIEGGKGQKPKVVRFQVRPDPLAK